MIESYIVLAERIKKELDDLERLVSRAKRAIKTAQKIPRIQIFISIQLL